MLEIIGMVFAALGFGCLSIGRLKLGFMVGLISCCFLIPLFYQNELYYMLTLQLYFATMNINGIRVTW